MNNEVIALDMAHAIQLLGGPDFSDLPADEIAHSMTCIAGALSIASKHQHETPDRDIAALIKRAVDPVLPGGKR